MIGGCFGFAMSLVLTGCGGGDAANGGATNSQKAEKPAESATSAQPAKVAPKKSNRKDINDLSPRERREQASGNS